MRSVFDVIIFYIQSISVRVRTMKNVGTKRECYFTYEKILDFRTYQTETEERY